MWKNLLKLVILVCLVVSIVLFITITAHADIASNVITTSTDSQATQKSSQRKLFYDTSNGLWWSFSNSGSAIAYFNSSNGTSWTSRGTTGVATNDFSVWYVEGTTTVYLIYKNSGFSVVKGTLGPTSITWGTVFNAVNSTIVAVNISRDSNGKLWAIYASNNGGGCGGSDTVRGVYASRSVNPDDTSSWVGSGAVEESCGGSGISDEQYGATQIIPMTTAGNMLAVFSFNDSIRHASQLDYNVWSESGSAWGTPTNIIYDGGSASSFLFFSMVDGSGDTADLVFIDSMPYLSHVQYSSGAFGAVSVIDSNATDVSLSKDIPNSNNLYAFYRDSSNNLKYKKYSSGSWDVNPTTIVSTGTNTSLSSAYHDGSGNLALTWMEGTGSPYNVRFYGVTTGAVLSQYSVSVATPQSENVCFTGTNKITAQDSNSATITSDTSTVNVTTTGNGITFYSASNCTGVTTQYTMAGGTAPIYVKAATGQGPFYITVTKVGSVETGTSNAVDVSFASSPTRGTVRKLQGPLKIQGNVKF